MHGVVWVLNGQCMRMFSEVLSQKFWRFIDGHVINTTLHWTEQVVIKVRYVDCLVDNQVIRLPRIRVVIGKRATDSVILYSTQGGVISLDMYRSHVVM